MKNKKQFTLIELIIVIVAIGILAAMALPKFNGVVRNAKLSAMINDKEVLEKALTMYYQKNDELPLLNEDEELIIANEGISLSKVVLAEEVKNSDMDTIYKSLKETLTYYNDREETLYRIDLPKIKDNLGKDIKYGHKKKDKDFYVYSTKTGNVYYYDYMVNGNGTIQHDEYDTLLKDNELVTKTISPSLSGDETIINNKPIIELTTKIDDIKPNSIINWTYVFIDEDEKPTKISFILNDIEYNDFNKIPTKLDKGDYNIKLKMQDSKGLWSNEVELSFIVKNILSFKDNKISLGKDFTIEINKDGDAYGFGTNYIGELGVGHTSNTIYPTKLIFSNTKPKSIYTGTSHSMAICEDEKLYSWGYNSHGQLGLGSTTTESKPCVVKLPMGVKAVYVSLGIAHSLIIGDDGNLYACGNNSYGQLGLGHTSKELTPQKVILPSGVTPKYISAGAYYSLMIGSDDNLYAWGYNSNGELGIGNMKHQTTPELVILPKGITVKTVSTGYSHSIMIGSDGNIYAWGNNKYGQLGIGSTIDKTTPVLVTLPNGEKPITIKLKNNHSMVITDMGNVYGWGENYSGQLGIGDATGSYQSPILAKIPTKIKDLYLGEKHTIFVDVDNNTYATGYNYYGQLGTLNKDSTHIPIKVFFP